MQLMQDPLCSRSARPGSVGVFSRCSVTDQTYTQNIPGEGAFGDPSREVSMDFVRLLSVET